MGLFSSKKVTTVATTVSRAIEDELLPNSIKTGALKSLYANDGQMVENTMEELATGLGNRVNRLYSYAKKNYTHGLPSQHMNVANAGRNLVEDILVDITGSQVEIDYFHFGPFNNLHLGWTKLVSEHGYNTVSNQLMHLTGAKETPVYLKDMVVVVTDASLEELENGALDEWGAPPNSGFTPKRPAVPLLASVRKRTPFEVDASAANDYLRVEYVWEVEVPRVINGIPVVINGVPQMEKKLEEDFFLIQLAGYDDQADYYQVKYAAGDVSGYWTYQAGSGVHLDLDNLFDVVPTGLGSFFPFVYFRYNKAPITAEENVPAYVSSDKMLKLIGMDYRQMIDGINQNPDIADVEQAMLMMAVPAETTNPVEQQYLYDFFNAVYLTSDEPEYPKNYAMQRLMKLMVGTADEDQQVPERSIIIQDKRFKMALHFNTVIKRKVTGSIGKKGSYSSGKNTESITKVGYDVSNGVNIPWTTELPCHYYRKQISTNVYEEVQVFNLRMTYFIWEGYNVTADEGDAILMVPIDYAISNNYSIVEREELYGRSLHYVFNSRIITKIKWYQTGVFRIIMTIIAIIVTIYTYGASWQAMAGAIAAGGLTSAIVSAIIIEVIKYVLVAAVVRLFVKVVGVKIAFIVAIIAAIYGGYQAIQAGSVAGAPWAQQLMSLSTSLSQGISDVMGDALLGLQSEAEAFGLMVETKTKLLEEAEKLLNGNAILNPLIILGESPNDYYQRTVHSGNIGVLSLDMISSYVDVALTLPKLNDTVRI